MSKDASVSEGGIAQSVCEANLAFYGAFFVGGRWTRLTSETLGRGVVPVCSTEVAVGIGVGCLDHGEMED